MFFCEVGPERVILRRCKTLWEKARVNWWVKVLFFWLFDFFLIFLRILPWQIKQLNYQIWDICFFNFYPTLNSNLSVVKCFVEHNFSSETWANVKLFRVFVCVAENLRSGSLLRSSFWKLSFFFQVKLSEKHSC